MSARTSTSVACAEGAHARERLSDRHWQQSRFGENSGDSKDTEAHQPLRAAIYARVSGPKQNSIPQQVALCRQRCDAMGHQVRYILKEEAKTAKDLNRPYLQHLLRLCAAGRIDIVVVWKLDRLVRSLRDLMNTFTYLEQHGVAIHSVTEQFDTSSSFGRFNFRNIASAAELERDLIAERARMGKLAQALQGRWPTQRPPLGYRLQDDRSLRVDPSESKVVKRIFNWYIEKVPLTEIARRLGEARTVTRRGVSFAPARLSAITRNEIYVGKLVLLDIEHDRPDLRIISDEAWSRAQERRGKRCTDAHAESRRQQAIDAVFDAYFDSLKETDPEPTEWPTPELPWKSHGASL